MTNIGIEISKFQLSAKSREINEALTTEKIVILDIMKHYLRLCHAEKKLLRIRKKKIQAKFREKVPTLHVSNLIRTYLKGWSFSSFNKNCFQWNNLELSSFLYIGISLNNRNLSFFHTVDCLTLCTGNRTVLNETKLKFCWDTVKFPGL